MKKTKLALVGVLAALAAGFVFTGCPGNDGNGTASTMTVNFEFADFTVDSFTVTAYNGKTVDDGYETVDATVAEDGASATCTVTDAYTNDSGWLTLNVVAKKDDEELSISFKKSSNSAEGAWFEFAEDGEITITYALVQTAKTTAISSEKVTIATEGTYQLAVSYDSIKGYDTVYITLAEITEWGEGSYDLPCLGTNSETWKANTKWIEPGAFVDENVESTTGGYFAEITPSDYADGVYITGKTGLAGTLFVSGANE